MRGSAYSPKNSESPDPLVCIASQIRGYTDPHNQLLAINRVIDKNELDPMQRIYHRIETEGFEALTLCERQYFAVWWLEAEANNGSFHQYFSNTSGELAGDALLGLRAFGADQMQSLFEEAIHLFPRGVVPKDRVERNRLLDSLTTQQLEELNRLSDRFTDYPDDIPKLAEHFIARHESEFKGPKTSLEQWHGRRAAGLPPEKVLSDRELKREAEADRALPSSRPCPECGQPTPSYRITCKRCSFPLGRAQDG